MDKIKLDCGCELDTKDGEPIMPLDITEVNLDCQAVWDLISSGKTIGGFQIDSGLGQSMSKKLKPQNINHLAALIAIMRPSCLNGFLEDGKSIADHFIDRKNQKESPICPYTVLDDILRHTYGLLIYQEDSIKIGQEIAGLTLQESDKYIRYGIGKKKAEIIAEAEKVFLAGCKNLGKVTEKEAKEIFEWLRSAQRYQFNSAHSYGYALTTYHTMYAKAHFPLRFFKSYLNHSKDKIKPLDEVKSLANDCRYFNIDLVNPDLRLKNKNFIIKDGRLYFGLGYIKGIGESATRTLVSTLEAFDLNNSVWTRLLFEAFLGQNKTVIKNLIAVGSLDYLGISREKLLYEHDAVLKLTKKEVEWIKSNIDLNQFNSIEPILADILSRPTGRGEPIANKNRQNIVKSLHSTVVKPSSSVKDKIRRMSALENSYLGVSLSCHKIDDLNLDLADTTCKECGDGKSGHMKLVVELTRVKEITTKKEGKRMAFIEGEDGTGKISDIAVFPEVWDKHYKTLFEGNTVLLVIYRSFKGSLVMSSCKFV